MLLLLTLLIVKHFILDFLYQPPYQWMNKGTYGHPGGLIHAGQHAFGTAVALALLFEKTPPTGSCLGFFGLLVFEFILHYHIDWAKMNINKRFGWASNTHNEFWILLGIDQLLHSLTYVAILAMVY